jgi:hypothetical protein
LCTQCHEGMGQQLCHWQKEVVQRGPGGHRLRHGRGAEGKASNQEGTSLRIHFRLQHRFPLRGQGEGAPATVGATLRAVLQRLNASDDVVGALRAHLTAPPVAVGRAALGPQAPEGRGHQVGGLAWAQHTSGGGRCITATHTKAPGAHALKLALELQRTSQHLQQEAGQAVS